MTGRILWQGCDWEEWSVGDGAGAGAGGGEETSGG